MAKSRAPVLVTLGLVAFSLSIAPSASPRAAVHDGAPAPPRNGAVPPGGAVAENTPLKLAVPEGWLDRVRGNILRSEYRFSVSRRGILSAPNRAQGIRTTVAGRGIEMVPLRPEAAAWKIGLRLKRFGREGALKTAGRGTVVVTQERVERKRAGLDEWYVNSPEGLQAGFSVSGDGTPEAKDIRDRPLQIEIGVISDARPVQSEDGSVVRFSDRRGTTVLEYRAPRVTDARGQEFPASLSLHDGELVISVDDKGAIRPLILMPLVTTPSWILQGPGPSSSAFGTAVSTAGDVNKDGLDDVVVGAPSYSGEFFQQGRAFLFMATENGMSLTPSWTADGENQYAFFGLAIAGGDVDGDGYGDVVVGSPGYLDEQELKPGRAYVFHNGGGALPQTASWRLGPTEPDLIITDFGSSIAMGDINNNGRDDVFIGAYTYSGGTKIHDGRAYGYMDGAGTPGWVVEGGEDQQFFGWMVAVAGDVNGDGYGDVLVSGYGNYNGSFYGGRVSLYYSIGGPPAQSPGWTVGGATQESIGTLLAGAGDVNGDGYADFLVGHHLGLVDVYMGTKDGPLPIPSRFLSYARSATSMSTGLAGAMDVNNDGFDDVLVNGTAVCNGLTQSSAFLHLGRKDGLLPGADWCADSRLGSPGIDDDPVATAGDVNGDGASDVIIGATNFSNGQQIVGAAYIYRGQGPGIEIVDPACKGSTKCDGDSLATVGGQVLVNQDIDELVKAEVRRIGVVADGVTLLLLRKHAAGQVMFSMTAPDGQPPQGLEWGTLMMLDGTSEGNTLTVDAQTTHDGKRIAFALYRPPENPPPGFTLPQPLEMDVQTSAGHESSVLTLVAPPVVLVHGVWSSATDAWGTGAGGMQGWLRGFGFNVCDGCVVDYSDQHAVPTFDPWELDPAELRSVKAIVDGVEAARRTYREAGMAITQVDVVGHSLGGLSARARVASQLYTYRKNTNFMKGDFHKLITIGSPHRGTALIDWLLVHKCERLNLPFRPTIEHKFESDGRPIGAGLYDMQTNAFALERLGTTDVPARAIAGIQQTYTDTEWWLDWIPWLSGHDTVTVQNLLGVQRNHDTIVSMESAVGQLSPLAFRVEPGVVHTDLSYDHEDVGETESMEVWRRVRDALLDPIDGVSFRHFTPLARSLVPPISQQPCPASAQPFEAPRPTTAIVEMTPAPGTIVQPGGMVTVQFTITGGNPVDGAVFDGDGRHKIVDGPGPFSAIFAVPESRAGVIELEAGTFGPGPENYAASTYIVVRRDDAPVSMEVIPSDLAFSLPREAKQIRVLGHFADGSVIDLSSANAGTTYGVSSGTGSVVTVSPDGLVQAVGAGSDAVAVTHGGSTFALPVNVTVTNRPPSMDPLGEITLYAGEALDLPITATDPDGNAISLSGMAIPAFAALTDSGGGAGLLALHPGDGDVGTFSMFVAARDDGLPPFGGGSPLTVTVLPCTGPTAGQTPDLSLFQDGSISWPPIAGARGYDMVAGFLSGVLNSGGDFSQATLACLTNDNPPPSAIFLGQPPLGDGVWFLVRDEHCAGHGTYDEFGPDLVQARDAEIEASTRGCP
jgi:hypothetical protein